MRRFMNIPEHIFSFNYKIYPHLQQINETLIKNTNKNNLRG